MSQRLKRWESPRREGRNDKGNGGSARQRQRQKQLQMLRQKLKRQSDDSKPERGESKEPLPSFFIGTLLLGKGKMVPNEL